MAGGLRYQTIGCLIGAVLASLTLAATAGAEFRAGAVVVDVSPTQLPVLINGSFRSREANSIKTPVSARALVVDDGEERMAIVVVDSCMIPRFVLDDAKKLAAARTEIAADRMMISATHTHSAPSCMGALGTKADTAYVSLLRERLATAIAEAERRLQPAEIGFAVGDVEAMTAVRRWVKRLDRIDVDPFGNRTVRANMHAARNPDEVTGPSGPEDPELAIIALRNRVGQPIALLANYSMHYFGDTPVSADYFGLFCNDLQDRLAATTDSDESPASPVVLMSHGCSGDIWLRDYQLPEADRPRWTIEKYAKQLADHAWRLYEKIDFQVPATIAMVEQRMTLAYRVPDAQRLQWAERIVNEMGDRLPETQTEVYAVEQLKLHEAQQTEVVVQAIRLGDIAIATTPNETYALTGWKLKLQSPLEQTIVIELANGGDGYIPPPEQHVLGGYNTWPARSAGLEVTAEPKIAAAALGLLEQLAGKARTGWRRPADPTTTAWSDLKPVAHWPLDDWQGPRAARGNRTQPAGHYEPGVVFFLEGKRFAAVDRVRQRNRAAHFTGGRLIASLPQVQNAFTLVLWCWNGVPMEDRDAPSWLASRDVPDSTSRAGQHLGIGGGDWAGRLVYRSDQGRDAVQQVGSTPLQRYRWHRVIWVVDPQRVRVFLDDQPQPEIDVPRATQAIPPTADWFFGGRSDREAPFEGRLDEIFVFDRALEPEAFPPVRIGAGDGVASTAPAEKD